MLFICKEFTKCDNDVIGLDPEIEHLEHTVPHSTNHGLSRGTGLLNVFSLRSLSFQSDALNAILGICLSHVYFQALVSSVLSSDRKSDGVIPFVNRDCFGTQNLSISQNTGIPDATE